MKLSNTQINLRHTVLNSLYHSKRGHIASAFSIIDVIWFLYTNFLKINPSNFDSINRDRFILSKGHGCLALYSVLSNLKFFDVSELNKFCKSNSLLGGHPDFKIPGVEFSTGSLGHGFPVATGIATYFKKKNINKKVCVLIGDGELQEGTNWESSFLCQKYKLDNLFLIIDYNKMQSFGSLKEVQEITKIKKKLESFDFEVKSCLAHDLKSINKSINSFKVKGKSKCLISNSIKGKGISEIENNSDWHHKSSLKKEDIDRLIHRLKA